MKKEKEIKEEKVEEPKIDWEPEQVEAEVVEEREEVKGEEKTDSDGFANVTKKVKSVQEVKDENTDPVIKRVNERRELFLKQYKNQRLINNIPFVLVLGGIIAIWLTVADKILWLALVLVVVLLIGLFVFSYFMKKSMNKKTKEYVAYFYKETSGYIYSEDVYNNVTYDVDAKIEPADFTCLNLYKDVKSVGSRNLVQFDYEGKHFKVCDCAASVAGKKRLEAVYVGKYVQSENNLELNGRIVIFYPGNDKSVPPNALDDLTLTEKINGFNIYVTANNEAELKKLITTKVKTQLRKIATDEILIDCSIVIQTGKTCAAVGYDDVLMILPLQSTFEEKPTKHFKQDLPDVLQALIAFDKETTSVVFFLK